MEIDTIILKCQSAETIHPPNEKSYAVRMISSATLCSLK